MLDGVSLGVGVDVADGEVEGEGELIIGGGGNIGAPPVKPPDEPPEEFIGEGEGEPLCVTVGEGYAL